MSATPSVPSPFARLLAARSVAVVGARPDSYWVRCLIHNLDRFGFTGRTHLVHPSHSEVLGRPCHRSVRDVDDQVDLAFILTSARHLDGVIEDLAAAGVGAAVALTSGFAELGADGEKEQRRLVEAARHHDIALLGPNCLGFIDYTTGLAPFCDLIDPPMPSGGVALVSQSGGLMQLAHRAAQRRRIGLSHMVSVGNESMITAIDAMRELVEVPEVTVLAAYLEAIREPQRFIELAERALELGKPIVAIKAGRSAAGANSARAHTGALAGDDRIIDALFTEYGVVRVDTPEALIETASLFSTLPEPTGPRLGLVSSSGGTCSIGADLVEGTELTLPQFSADLQSRLRAALPEFATPQNPLDTTGAIVNDREMLGRCTEALADSGEVDLLIVNVDLPPVTPEGDDESITRRLESVAQALSGLRVPAVLTPTFAGDSAPERVAHFRDRGIAVVDGLGSAVTGLDQYVVHAAARARRLAGDAGAARPPAVPAAPPQGVRNLSEQDSLQLLADAGVPANTGAVVRSVEDAVAAARAIGHPVVAKVHSSDVAHKSELGGVRLDLRDDDAVARAAGELLALGPDAEVLVVDQVNPVGELIAGIVVDPAWGPVVLVGIGGIFAETLDDTALGLPGLGFDQALRMVRGLRGIDMFTGARGRPAADLAHVARALVALGELAAELPAEVTAIDVNPLFVCTDRVVAGDALVVVAR